jgi:hypothetical protein
VIWFAKATVHVKFLDGNSRVSLFEEADDLLIGKYGLFQSRYSSKLANFVPSLWFSRGKPVNMSLVPCTPQACKPSSESLCKQIPKGSFSHPIEGKPTMECRAFVGSQTTSERLVEQGPI